MEKDEGSRMDKDEGSRMHEDDGSRMGMIRVLGWRRMRVLG